MSTSIISMNQSPPPPPPPPRLNATQSVPPPSTPSNKSIPPPPSTPSNKSSPLPPSKCSPSPHSLLESPSADLIMTPAKGPPPQRLSLEELPISTTTTSTSITSATSTASPPQAEQEEFYPPPPPRKQTISPNQSFSSATHSFTQSPSADLITTPTKGPPPRLSFEKPLTSTAQVEQEEFYPPPPPRKQTLVPEQFISTVPDVTSSPNLEQEEFYPPPPPRKQTLAPEQFISSEPFIAPEQLISTVPDVTSPKLEQEEFYPPPPPRKQTISPEQATALPQITELVINTPQTPKPTGPPPPRTQKTTSPESASIPATPKQKHPPPPRKQTINDLEQPTTPSVETTPLQTAEEELYPPPPPRKQTIDQRGPPPILTTPTSTPVQTEGEQYPPPPPKKQPSIDPQQATAITPSSLTSQAEEEEYYPPPPPKKSVTVFSEPTTIDSQTTTPVQAQEEEYYPPPPPKKSVTIFSEPATIGPQTEPLQAQEEEYYPPPSPKKTSTEPTTIDPQTTPLQVQEEEYYPPPPPKRQQILDPEENPTSIITTPQNLSPIDPVLSISSKSPIPSPLNVSFSLVVDVSEPSTPKRGPPPIRTPTSSQTKLHLTPSALTQEKLKNEILPLEVLTEPFTPESHQRGNPPPPPRQSISVVRTSVDARGLPPPPRKMSASSIPSGSASSTPTYQTSASAGQLPLLALGSHPSAASGQPLPVIVLGAHSSSMPLQTSHSAGQLSSLTAHQEHPTSAPAVEESKEQKMYRHRKKVLREILDTEKSYCTSLSTLAGVASPALQKILTDAEHKLLFSNIETLLEMNGNLAFELDRRISNITDLTCIGDIFLKFTPYLKLYSQYVSNHDAASRFDRELSQQKRFVEIGREIFGNPRVVATGATNLAFFFIMPIQRIPRYSLLLGETIKCTPDDHPDKENLKKAIEQVNAVAHHVNRSITGQQQRHQVYEMAQLMGLDLATFVQPQRRFVKRGPGFKICFGKDKLYEFFLFNDLLIYASGGPAKFKPHSHIPIDHQFYIEDVPDDTKHSHQFKIVNGVKTFIAYFNSLAEKTEWSKIMVELSEIAQGKIRRDAPETPRSTPILAPGTPVSVSRTIPNISPESKSMVFFSLSSKPSVQLSPPAPTTFDIDVNIYRPSPLNYKAVESFQDTTDSSYILYEKGDALKVSSRVGEWWVASNPVTAKAGFINSHHFVENITSASEQQSQQNPPIYSAMMTQNMPVTPAPNSPPKNLITYLEGDLVLVIHELNDWSWFYIWNQT